MTTTTFAKWLIIAAIISLATKPQILIHGQQVPCFFIFGDSQFDNGNNNGLITRAKANYSPYGIDYPGAVPTGRFTNNLNSADYLARLLGFNDSIPPFVTTSGSDVLRGLNYASGASGILDISGAQLGDHFSMNRQLQNHLQTVGEISSLLGNQTAAGNYLQQCLYAVNMGSNDYINNYYLKLSLSRVLFTPDTFANILINTFSKQLRTLYKLGARKVAVYGAGLIGCIPQELALYPTNGSPCVDSINNAVGLFNNKLVSLIKDLNINLPNAKFTYINATNIALGDPSLIGVTVVNAPCCEIDATTGQCARNGAVCSNRNVFAFFDNYHTTDILNKATASRSYNALLPADASPVDIRNLVMQ